MANDKTREVVELCLKIDAIKEGGDHINPGWGDDTAQHYACELWDAIDHLDPSDQPEALWAVMQGLIPWAFGERQNANSIRWLDYQVKRDTREALTVACMRAYQIKQDGQPSVWLDELRSHYDEPTADEPETPFSLHWK